MEHNFKSLSKLILFTQFKKYVEIINVKINEKINFEIKQETIVK